MKIYNTFVAKITNIVDSIGRKAQIQTVTQDIETEQHQSDNITIVAPKGIYTTTTPSDNITVQTLADGELIGYANNGSYTKTQIEAAYQDTALDVTNQEDMFLGGVIGNTRIIIKQSDNSITLMTSAGKSVVIDASGNISILGDVTIVGNLNVQGGTIQMGSTTFTDVGGKGAVGGKEIAVFGGITTGNASTQTITTPGQ